MNLFPLVKNVRVINIRETKNIPKGIKGRIISLAYNSVGVEFETFIKHGHDSNGDGKFGNSYYMNIGDLKII